MDLDTLAKLGEFVGGSFVVISLIYLAHQVRQNTRSLRTENYARVLERMSTLQSRLAADGGLNRVLVVGAEDPAALTPAERTRFSWALYELFGAAEFMYHQSRHNALPVPVWERWEASLGWWLSHPGMKAWWGAKPAPMSADFAAFVETMLRDHRVEAPVIERWHRFVAGHGLPPSPPPDARRGNGAGGPAGPRPAARPADWG